MAVEVEDVTAAGPSMLVKQQLILGLPMLDSQINPRLSACEKSTPSTPRLDSACDDVDLDGGPPDAIALTGPLRGEETTMTGQDRLRGDDLGTSLQQFFGRAVAPRTLADSRTLDASQVRDTNKK